MNGSNNNNFRILLDGNHNPDGAVTSVIRALAILDLLGSTNGEELGITEISNMLSLHKSTVFRLISTLVLTGYVQQNPKTGKYLLGIHLLELGMVVLNKLDLRRIAQPFLKKLAEATDEVVHLGILEQDEVIYIDKFEIERPLTMGSRIGGRAPAYCTGLGKMLLAFQPKEILNRIISNSKFTRFSPNTITDPSTLIEHLNRIREQGYSIDDEEHELGIRCGAAPIKDYHGQVIAAISVSGPSLRMTRAKMDQILPLIIQAGNSISHALGYSQR